MGKEDISFFQGSPGKEVKEEREDVKGLKDLQEDFLAFKVQQDIKV